MLSCLGVYLIFFPFFFISLSFSLLFFLMMIFFLFYVLASTFLYITLVFLSFHLWLPPVFLVALSVYLPLHMSISFFWPVFLSLSVCLSSRLSFFFFFFVSFYTHLTAPFLSLFYSPPYLTCDNSLQRGLALHEYCSRCCNGTTNIAHYNCNNYCHYHHFLYYYYYSLLPPPLYHEYVGVGALCDASAGIQNPPLPLLWSWRPPVTPLWPARYQRVDSEAVTRVIGCYGNLRGRVARSWEIIWLSSLVPPDLQF